MIDENEWGKIDLNQTPEDTEVETEETIEVDIEPEVEIEQEQSPDDKEPELDGIETKGAEKRIRQLIPNLRTQELSLKKLMIQETKMLY